MTRVLVFNFFGGVMDRGIPLYATDIVEAMRRVGIDAVEMRCPKWLQRAPRLVRNVAFVLFEQLVAPAARIAHGCVLTVYPYNSAGIVDAALGRSVLVVHDLLSNRRENRTLAARYIRATQAIHRAWARPVCAASRHTLGHLRRLDAFRPCPLKLWSNPFYSFEAALARHRSGHAEPPAEASRKIRVLLCSGLGENKDYGGALKLFVNSRALCDVELRVVGFGNDARLARRRLHSLPDERAVRVTVLPRLRLDELVAEYMASDIVWVHSRGEGFGRSVVEARLSGRPVLVSDISAFRKFAGVGVYTYRHQSFDAVTLRALGDERAPPLGAIAYHAPLEAAVLEVVETCMRPGAGTGVEPRPEPAAPETD